MAAGYQPPEESAFGVAALLMSQGVPPDQAAFWETFVRDCFDMLRNSDAELRKNWSSLLFKLSGRKGRKSWIPEETDVTTELYGYCLAQRDRFTIDDRRKSIVPKCEDPKPSSRRSGKHSERRDLLFFHAAIDREFVFEAKRLLGASTKDYIGRRGIGVFTDRPEPHTRQPVGAMLGYVFAGTCEEWFDRIARTSGTEMLRNLLIEGEQNRSAYSLNERSNCALPPILLVHHMLDYSINLSANAPTKGS